MSPLELCRARDKAFDVHGTIDACLAVIALPVLPAADRVEAMKLLAGAQVVADDEGAAEVTFVHMLILDGTAKPPATAGPRVQENFSRARQVLEGTAAVNATVVFGPARNVVVDVVDPLGRVTSAHLQLGSGDAVSDIVLNAAGDLRGRYAGAVPAGLAGPWRLVLAGPTGAVVTASGDSAGTFDPAARPAAPSASSSSSSAPAAVRGDPTMAFVGLGVALGGAVMVLASPLYGALPSDVGAVVAPVAVVAGISLVGAGSCMGLVGAALALGGGD